MKFPLSIETFPRHGEGPVEYVRLNDGNGHRVFGTDVVEGDSQMTAMAVVRDLANEAASYRDESPVTEALLLEYGFIESRFTVGGTPVVRWYYVFQDGNDMSYRFHNGSFSYLPNAVAKTAGRFRLAMALLGIQKREGAYP